MSPPSHKRRPGRPPRPLAEFIRTTCWVCQALQCTKHQRVPKPGTLLKVRIPTDTSPLKEATFLGVAHQPEGNGKILTAIVKLHLSGIPEDYFHIIHPSCIKQIQHEGDPAFACMRKAQ